LSAVDCYADSGHCSGQLELGRDAVLAIPVPDHCLF
jgi:hypothetical protein